MHTCESPIVCQLHTYFPYVCLRSFPLVMLDIDSLGEVGLGGWVSDGTDLGVNELPIDRQWSSMPAN